MRSLLRPAPPRPRGGRLLAGVLLTVAIVVAVAAALIGLAAHVVPATRPWALGVVAASPYLMLGAPLAVILAAVARRRRVAAACAVVTLLCAATQAGLVVARTAPADAVRLTVLTANLRLGEADAAAVVAAVRRDRVAVLMLEELTPDEQARLVGAGLNRELPFHSSEPRPSADGTGLWSRYPLTSVQHVPGFTFAFVTARIRIPGVAGRPTLAALHLAGPVPVATDWRHDVRRLPAVLRALPTDAPVIVGGDFNATPDTAQFRSVLAAGFEDAADQAGGGLTRTYPADRWFPPLIAIDHVLCRGGAVATRTNTVRIAGSDHRALLVHVALPR